jgi:hypothetical protein
MDTMDTTNTADETKSEAGSAPSTPATQSPAAAPEMTDEEASLQLALQLMQEESMNVYERMQSEAIEAASAMRQSQANLGQGLDLSPSTALALRLAEEDQNAMQRDLPEGDIDPDEMTYVVHKRGTRGGGGG